MPFETFVPCTRKGGRAGLIQPLAFPDINLMLPRLQITRTYPKCFYAGLKMSQRVKMLKLIEAILTFSID